VAVADIFKQLDGKPIDVLKIDSGVAEHPTVIANLIWLSL